MTTSYVRVTYAYRGDENQALVVEWKVSRARWVRKPPRPYKGVVHYVYDGRHVCGTPLPYASAPELSGGDVTCKKCLARIVELDVSDPKRRA